MLYQYISFFAGHQYIISFSVQFMVVGVFVFGGEI